MRYYLIAGEPSGDLHASRLMKALKVQGVGLYGLYSGAAPPTYYSSQYENVQGGCQELASRCCNPC